MSSTIKVKIGKCIDCGPDVKEKPLTAKRCFHHYWIHRDEVNSAKKTKVFEPRKPIAKVSAKRKIENREYTIKRLQFLAQPENLKCFIDGCNSKADTIEHSAGRIGKNFLDVTTWRPCCNYHNLELERNSELSEKYQISKISGKQKIIKTSLIR